MRRTPYTGPDDTNDFDNLDADQAAALMQAYKYLGDAFETTPADDMLGRGWLIDDPLTLLDARGRRAARAERELAAAVALARHQGCSWGQIAEALELGVSEVRRRFDAGCGGKE